MSPKKTFLKAALATLALATTAAVAYAAPAVSTGNVNVRTGPGPGYSVVDTLQRGETVDVDNCRGSWCYVVKSGPDGWVASSFLDSGRGYRDDRRDYRNDRNYGDYRGFDDRPRRRGPRYRDDFDDGYYSGRPVLRPVPPPYYGRPYPRYRDPGVCFGSPNASVCIN